jgi:hypothetical protein
MLFTMNRQSIDLYVKAMQTDTVDELPEEVISSVIESPELQASVLQAYFKVEKAQKNHRYYFIAAISVAASFLLIFVTWFVFYKYNLSDDTQTNKQFSQTEIKPDAANKKIVITDTNPEPPIKKQNKSNDNIEPNISSDQLIALQQSKYAGAFLASNDMVRAKDTPILKIEINSPTSKANYIDKVPFIFKAISPKSDVNYPKCTILIFDNKGKNLMPEDIEIEADQQGVYNKTLRLATLHPGLYSYEILDSNLTQVGTGSFRFFSTAPQFK